jgi:hypothetical protein
MPATVEDVGQGSYLAAFDTLATPSIRYEVAAAIRVGSQRLVYDADGAGNVVERQETVRVFPFPNANRFPITLPVRQAPPPLRTATASECQLIARLNDYRNRGEISGDCTDARMVAVHDASPALPHRSVRVGRNRVGSFKLDPLSLVLCRCTHTRRWSTRLSPSPPSQAPWWRSATLRAAS